MFYPLLKCKYTLHKPYWEIQMKYYCLLIGSVMPLYKIADARSDLLNMLTEDPLRMARALIACGPGDWSSSDGPTLNFWATCKDVRTYEAHKKSLTRSLGHRKKGYIQHITRCVGIHPRIPDVYGALYKILQTGPDEVSVNRSKAGSIVQELLTGFDTSLPVLFYLYALDTVPSKARIFYSEYMKLPPIHLSRGIINKDIFEQTVAVSDNLRPIVLCNQGENGWELTSFDWDSIPMEDKANTITWCRSRTVDVVPDSDNYDDPDWLLFLKSPSHLALLQYAYNVLKALKEVDWGSPHEPHIIEAGDLQRERDKPVGLGITALKLEGKPVSEKEEDPSVRTEVTPEVVAAQPPMAASPTQLVSMPNPVAVKGMPRIDKKQAIAVLTKVLDYASDQMVQEVNTALNNPLGDCFEFALPHELDPNHNYTGN